MLTFGWFWTVVLRSKQDLNLGKIWSLNVVTVFEIPNVLGYLSVNFENLFSTWKKSNFGKSFKTKSPFFGPKNLNSPIKQGFVTKLDVPFRGSNPGPRGPRALVSHTFCAKGVFCHSQTHLFCKKKKKKKMKKITKLRESSYFFVKFRVFRQTH